MILKRERGFSLIELLIVITLMSIIFGVTVPFYRRYVAQTALRNVSQDLYLKLVTAHNNAINGVLPKTASAANQRYWWVVTTVNASGLWQYETGACPLQSIPPATQTQYDNQFSFSWCSTEEYKLFKFPTSFVVSHQYSATNSAVAIYFEPISGQVRVYDLAGARLDNPADMTSNVIDIVISSADYPSLQVRFHVNRQGTISQESS